MAKPTEPTVALRWADEPTLLQQVAVRLLASSERRRFDRLLKEKHYLHNPTLVGQALRYVVEIDGQWVALLTFSSAAWHLKARDRWLEWSPRQVEERRQLIAQNSRFLLLTSPGECPNLASRVLRLVCDRLSSDWEKHFGHPVLAVETFVDPDQDRGTCYKAAGWERLGPTQGYGRVWRDFYTDTEHPKELWVRALGKGALARLRAKPLEPITSSSPRATSPRPRPKPSNCCPANFPPQAQTLDKSHGRVEHRQLWRMPVLPEEVALAGAAQLARIERQVDKVRKGRVIKTTTEVVYAVTSRWTDQITPDQLLALARDHWTIENRQHHRRDRTQDEDRCLVRNPRSARNLSLFRTRVIYLFERQRPRSGACRSLPDFQRRGCRQPGRVIQRLRCGLSVPSS
jgi:hypothetical protein